jgi:type II secretory pathway pseudopilin PulG
VRLISPSDAAARERGFTLIEAVVAGAMLLMTVTAVTFCVVAGSKGEARLQATMDADRAVDQVGERLRRLPFCASAYPDAGSSTGDAAGDVVSAVFPHADALLNAAAARYVVSQGGAGEKAGCFVTVFTQDGIAVRCVARFLQDADGPALGPPEVAGWDRTRSEAPPGAGLSVVLSAAAGGSERVETFVRAAAARPARDRTTAGGG